MQQLCNEAVIGGTGLKGRGLAYHFAPARHEIWLDLRRRTHVGALAGADGLTDPSALPTGPKCREPDGGWPDQGRANLHQAARRDAVGGEVTYIMNRDINVTTICYTGCRFRAVTQRKTNTARVAS